MTVEVSHEVTLEIRKDSEGTGSKRVDGWTGAILTRIVFCISWILLNVYISWLRYKYEYISSNVSKEMHNPILSDFTMSLIVAGINSLDLLPLLC